MTRGVQNFKTRQAAARSYRNAQRGAAYAQDDEDDTMTPPESHQSGGRVAVQPSPPYGMRDMVTTYINRPWGGVGGRPRPLPDDL